MVATERWPAITRTIGIIDLLWTTDERPAQLADEVIVQIRKQESEGVVKLPPRPRLKRGQPCRVTHSGSFWGRLGIFDGMRWHIGHREKWDEKERLRGESVYAHRSDPLSACANDVCLSDSRGVLGVVSLTSAENRHDAGS